MIINANQGGGGQLQARTAIPSTSQQVIEPESPYYGLSKVTVESAPLEATRYVNAATYEQHITPESPNIGLSEVVVNPAILESRSVTMSKSTETFYPLSSSSYGMSQITIGIPSMLVSTGIQMPDQYLQTVACQYPINYFPTAIYIDNKGAANLDTSGKYCMGDVLMFIRELSTDTTAIDISGLEVYGMVFRNQSVQLDFDFVFNLQMYVNSIILDRTNKTISVNFRNELYVPYDSTKSLRIYIWSRLVQ